MSTLHAALAELADRIEASATEARNASYGQPDATWARLDGMATQAMAAVADIRDLLAAHPAPEVGEVRLTEAERERRVRAEAIREAAEACRRMADQAEVDAGGKLDRWDAFVEAVDWCLLRADRIEAGE